MKKLILVISFFFFLILPKQAWAHQPRIVSQEKLQVENPEVSQAFYGELKGKPVSFEINSTKPFILYLNLLVPDLPGIEKDVSARVYSGEEEIFFLDGTNFNWVSFFEEFAGDNYFKGPEIEEEVEQGKYLVEVFSSDNQGKYVLAIGKKEEFPPGETVETIFLLPQLKKNFFNKSPFTAFFNLIGLFLLIPLLILFAIVLIAFFLIRKIKRKKRTEKEKIKRALS